jgi:hypothetical protein
MCLADVCIHGLYLINTTRFPAPADMGHHEEAHLHFEGHQQDIHSGHDLCRDLATRSVACHGGVIGHDQAAVGRADIDHLVAFTPDSKGLVSGSFD